MRVSFRVIAAVAAVFLAWSATAEEVRVLRTASGRVDRVELEEYVAAVLPGEIGRAPREALLAQAIAVRSYVLGHLGRHSNEDADVCDSTHCQVYKGRHAVTPQSRSAAAQTKGLVLSREDRVVAAPFHAHCGGHTTRPVDVWDDEEVPEFPPVEDDACLKGSSAPWAYRLTRAQLGQLGAKLGLAGARYFEVYGRDASGRVSMVRLAAPGGLTLIVRGFDFRKAAMELWGWDSVRSTLFEFEEQASEYLVIGRGHGHGAGLCQAGAIQRAARGESWKEILGHYYGGTDIRPLSRLTPLVAHARETREIPGDEPHGPSESHR